MDVAQPNSTHESTIAPGVYIHVPFCSSVCPYCDFSVRRDLPREHRRYVTALSFEAGRRRGELSQKADTLYFGGGTPSVLSAEVFREAVGGLEDSGILAEDVEIFLEANPEHVDRERLVAWRDAGVSFLSLGVQALNDRDLEFLGRSHDQIRARKAIDDARDSGIRTISIDLIYGLPHRNLSDWQLELDAALDSGVDHLSLYLLTINEKTPFGLRARRGTLRPVDDDLEAEIFRATHRRVEERGWIGYEASNFAKTPTNRSRHNTKYWTHAPYLGLGPSAHSFDGSTRSWNVERFERWLAALDRGESTVEGRESLSPTDLLFETFMLGLRMRDGIDLSMLERRFGTGVYARNKATIERWIARGFAEIARGRLLPTVNGIALADSLAAEIEA